MTRPQVVMSPRCFLLSLLLLLHCSLYVLSQDVVVAGDHDDHSDKNAVLPSRCLQVAPLESRCKAAKRSYFYSPEVKDCVSFMYGGCGEVELTGEEVGGMNLFLDPLECTEVCKAGICPINMCLMECPNGLEQDENGCEVCQCKPRPDQFPAVATCQLMACPGICISGYVLDANGCQTCACKKADIPSVSACQQMACPDVCKNGFTLDSQGCQTCECQPELAVCQQMACPDICENGYTFDWRGCQTCECQPSVEVCQPLVCPKDCLNVRIYTDSSGCRKCECPSIPVECQDLSVCPKNCPNGYTRRVEPNGCVSCNCAEKSVLDCPAVECDERCPRGYAVDTDGCQTCKCIQPRTSCPVGPTCLIHCPHGNMLNQQGCPVCRCASDPSPSPGSEECSPVACHMFCPRGGFRKDHRGCDVCECASDPSPDLPGSEECSPVACHMFCPRGGFRKDHRGCDVCECAEDPCESLNCLADEICLKEENNPGKAKCVSGHRPWCSLAMCSMFCEHGFETNEYGCQQCRCRSSPATWCPEVSPSCFSQCTFGYAYDSNGCKTCNCLPNGCETKKCYGHEEVCAVKVQKSCTGCPITPVCTADDDVTRARVTLTYLHNTILVRHTEDVQRQITISVSSMLQIMPNQVSRMTVRRGGDLRTTVANFTLNTRDHSVVPAYHRLHRRIQEDDGRRSQLVVHGVTFTPQAESMQVVYYTGDVEDKEDEVEVEEVGYSAAIVVIAVVLICIVSGSILTICILACKRRRHHHRSNAIYKPVGTAIHM